MSGKGPSMRTVIRVLGAVLAAACCLTVASDATATESSVTRRGTQLLRDGKPFRFVGLNVYNANSRSWNGNCGGAVDLDEAAGAMAGLPVIRAWFYQWQATDAEGRRDWSAFDQTLATAKKRGLSIIVTLGDQWGDCEGYQTRAAGYKGLSWYSSGYRTQVRSPQLAATYRDYVREVVSRYRNDPTVLMWQMMNEAEAADSLAGRCSKGAPAALRGFAKDIGNVIRDADPGHLISLGTIGTGQCGLAGDQYRAVQAIPQIDVLEYHDYSRYGSEPDSFNGLGVRLQQARRLDKPIFIGEIGAELSPGSGAAGRRARALQVASTLRARFADGVAGTVVWRWSDPVHGGRDPYAVGPADPLLPALVGIQEGIARP